MNAKTVSAKKVGTKTKNTRRLTPKPEVLRELFLLSGNNCAMANCPGVIISNQGTVTGRVCHIEAAMPEGPRFNAGSTNEKRRAADNLILLCAGHHSMADDKKHEKKWTVERLREIKRVHEAKFRGLDETLTKAFETGFNDVTDLLAPTTPTSFKTFVSAQDAVFSDDKDRKKTQAAVSKYIQKLSLVPNEEREFMLSIINRATKLKRDSMTVPVDDVKSALGIAQSRIKRLGEALEFYKVGGIWEVGFGDKDRYCVVVSDPSNYLMWVEIVEFCKMKSIDLRSFVIDLNFAQLD